MSAKFGTLGPAPETFTHPAETMGGRDQRSFRRGALRSEKSKEQIAQGSEVLANFSCRDWERIQNPLCRL